MGKIQILDEKIALLIAAGEVVERPACIVKELVENSLDAKSSQIDIYLEQGGMRKIIVKDDGCGMLADDAVLCFSRHATSKIKEADDLDSLTTFGFRGEALASIASVAQVKLFSKLQDALLGATVQVNGGHIVSVKEAGGAPGSLVEVENLFYNVPARLKFLRSVRQEAFLVEQVLKTAALSAGHVGFSLYVDGVAKWHIPKAPKDAELSHPRVLERVAACLPGECEGYVFPFKAAAAELSVAGHLVSPLVSRKDFRGIRLFVNSRPIEDRALSQAVRVAYRTLLEVGRYPICALNIQIEPSLVDVNVHPRKSEVRFCDPSLVLGRLIGLLQNFLSTTPWLNPAESQPTSYSFTSFSSARPSATWGLSYSGYSSLSSKGAGDETMSPWAVVKSEAEKKIEQEKKLLPSPFEHALVGADCYANLRIIGQVKNTFLLLESPEAFVILDQHAAHERVIFEGLKKEAGLRALASQPFLFPLQIKISQEEMVFLQENMSLLLKYGFEVEPFGTEVAVIRATPAGIDEKSAQQIIQDILAGPTLGTQMNELQDFTHRMCAQIACHTSVRAGQKMEISEIQALLDKLDKIDYRAQCPHGRPIVKAISFTEMARWFHRL